jgi:transcriptional regulator with XRE-family HTH domain
MATDKPFGALFRESREALGLSLSEFCRRNGFDKGNVSRLERGLMSPPQSQATLEEYAEALQLGRGTDRWDRFFELAAAETGRIPTDILRGHATADQVPRLLRQLRGGPGHRNWVTARHLEEWAGTRSAQDTLPQLVRRLVHATGRGLSRVEFPSGEQVNRPGFDGVVDALEGGAFVPAGPSVWQMGVGKDPREKAEDDFEASRGSPLRGNKRQTTYVFVTPRKWQDKGKWLKEKTRLRIWKEVKVYDSATLEEWIEQAATVDVWLARALGLRPVGLVDTDEYWENLKALTEPSLGPEVFLASRAKEVKKLGDWLKSRPGANVEESGEWPKGLPGAIVIEAPSPVEGIDFVAAVAQRLPDWDRDSFVARAVIVETREAWRSIIRATGDLVLVAHPTLEVEPEMVAEVVRQGHRVILPSGRGFGDKAFTVRLPRVSQHDLQKALSASGLERPKAEEYTRKAGNSLVVLKRLLGCFPGTVRPRWCQPEESEALIPVLLAGGWDETNEADRQILEQLAGRPYHNIASLVGRWLQDPDPPVTRVLSRWGLVSRDDSWHLLAQAITAGHLERFEEATLEVLGHIDPALDLPADERWLAGIEKKVLPHSTALRTGLAETLALMGARPERIQARPELPAQVGYIVRCLLDGAEWKKWASLSAELPLLAEAAPGAFLEAVEHDLQSDAPALPELFAQESSSFFSSSPHPWLLWALEGLAWDSTLLPRVSYAMTALDERTRRGNLGNSPLRSLEGIFTPWYPQTTVPVSERVRILSEVARRAPSAGWRLLLALLPYRLGTAMPIHRPACRDWALGWSEGASNAEFWHQVSACADKLIDLADADAGRLVILIGQLENLPGPARDRLMDRLATIDVSALGADGNRAVADALRDAVVRHGRLAEAEGTLPIEVVTRLDEARRHLEPDDIVLRNAWLFNAFWRVKEVAGDDADVAELRLAALQQIRSQAGWDGILRLAEVSGAPDELGAALGERGSAEDDARVLPGLFQAGSEKRLRLALGYVPARNSSAGPDWLRRLDTSRWSPEEVGQVAINLPFGPETWDLVASMGPGIESFYWAKVQNVLGIDGDSDTVRRAALKLLAHHRPFSTCRMLSAALHRGWRFEPALALDALEGGIMPPHAESAAMQARHTVVTLLVELQKRVQEADACIDVERVARLEWGYLGFLDGRPATPETLHAMLDTHPESFVELLKIAFRARDEPRGEEPSEEEKARARNAFELLHSWRRIPGTAEDGTIEEEALVSWVTAARDLAEQQGRIQVCDFYIGTLLAHALGRPGMDWLAVPVRDAIEDLASDDLDRGFELGILNRRGPYGKAPHEGGDQERSLAEQYRAWAELCKIEWPRTAAALLKVADRYEDEARREDAEAERQ